MPWSYEVSCTIISRYATHVRSDSANPDLIHIKVGRTNNLHRRLLEHRRYCPSLTHRLLGYYPVAVRYCDRLERLVHTELTDLAAHSYVTGRNQPNPCCPDC